ncbi:hypothetical protein PAXINDRAFT_18633 [Paxillus involutus ATCC 200175]|uniref:Terpene synthase n=1 Tax=Paxillus involutus ATCC 200175 TaxID=664439 RepID=A0A0C9TLN6_PAXIN|nr:hypothetical protein PAXINDRAFT_18633 [Paxillus involutus ATCC 200175]
MPPVSPAYPSPPTKVVLPDLISYCPFDPHISRHHKLVSIESKRWLFNGIPHHNEQFRRETHGLKCGRFAARCYPNASYPQLRVCSDFLHWLFHIDDLSDDIDSHSIRNVSNVVMNSLYHPHTYRSSARLNWMTTDFYKRMIQTASPGTCQRLKEGIEIFFRGLHQEAIDRASGYVPDLGSYITLRRDTSACKACWVLIEYVNNLDIPDEVMDHPIIRSLNDTTIDFAAWSNDLYSYHIENSKGHTHNIIDAVMKEKDLDVQGAMDFVGELCKRSIDRFVEDRKKLPSWGEKIDKDVAVYVEGLADWMPANLHWCFETERYYGKQGKEVKKTRVVTLLPKIRNPTNLAASLATTGTACL